mmetsp:Transcript_76624/g.212935  ORF Transcript_76624/g.212935 Transcript_76624/m.212935 type:complete len:283 (+) Transcript_76624:174-1022(+)
MQRDLARPTSRRPRSRSWSRAQGLCLRFFALDVLRLRFFASLSFGLSLSLPSLAFFFGRAPPGVVTAAPSVPPGERPRFWAPPASLAPGPWSATRFFIFSLRSGTTISRSLTPAVGEHGDTSGGKRRFTFNFPCLRGGGGGSMDSEGLSPAGVGFQCDGCVLADGSATCGVAESSFFRLKGVGEVGRQCEAEASILGTFVFSPFALFAVAPSAARFSFFSFFFFLRCRPGLVLGTLPEIASEAKGLRFRRRLMFTPGSEIGDTLRMSSRMTLAPTRRDLCVM